MSDASRSAKASPSAPSAQHAVERLHESLHKRYQDMINRKNKMYFPPALLEKIRHAAVNNNQTRISKPLQQLLLPLQPNQAAADPATIVKSANSTDEQMRFYCEVLRSAEAKRAVHLPDTHVKETPLHMQALLVNSDKQKKATYDAQHQRLGALDLLLREERVRQQQHRAKILGLESLNAPMTHHGRKKRAKKALQQVAVEQAEESKEEQHESPVLIPQPISPPVSPPNSLARRSSLTTAMLPLQSLDMDDISVGRTWAMQQAQQYADAVTVLYGNTNHNHPSIGQLSTAIFEETLHSPAKPLLHSAEVLPQQSLPDTFQEGYYTFSDTMRLPLHSRIIKSKGMKNISPDKKKLVVSSTPSIAPLPIDDDRSPTPPPARNEQAERDVFARIAAAFQMDTEEDSSTENQLNAELAAMHAPPLSIDTSPLPSGDDYQLSTFRVSSPSRHNQPIQFRTATPRHDLILDVPVSARIWMTQGRERYEADLKEEELYRAATEVHNTQAQTTLPAQANKHDNSDSSAVIRPSTSSFLPHISSLSTLAEEDAAHLASTSTLPPSNKQELFLTHTDLGANTIGNASSNASLQGNSSLSSTLSLYPRPPPRTAPSTVRHRVLSAPVVPHVAAAPATRAHRVGTPLRRTQRYVARDDPSHALTPLTDDGWYSTRGHLMHEVAKEHSALEKNMQHKQVGKDQTSNVLSTDLVLYAPATLHLTSTVASSSHAHASSVQVALKSSSVGDVTCIKMTPAHNAASSHAASSISLPHTSSHARVPSAPPPQSTLPTSANSVPGSHASHANISCMAEFVSPLRTLKQSGMNNIATGLTVVQQLLPCNNEARVMTRLYGYYQRHLFRSKEYFNPKFQQRKRGKAKQANINHTQLAGEKSKDLSLPTPAVTTTFTSRVMSPVLSQHQSELGASNITPNTMRMANSTTILRPTLSGVTGYAKPDIQSDRLQCPTTVRRRGGGFVGVLDGLDAAAVEEGINVLAHMVDPNYDSIENEQAMRVLNSFDQQQLMYPTHVLARAHELHAVLDAQQQQKDLAQQQQQQQEQQTQQQQIIDATQPAPVTSMYDASEFAMRAHNMNQFPAQRKFAILKSYKLFQPGENTVSPRSHARHASILPSSAPSSSRPFTSPALPTASPTQPMSYDACAPLSACVEADAAQRVLANVTASKQGLMSDDHSSSSSDYTRRQSLMPAAFAMMHHSMPMPVNATPYRPRPHTQGQQPGVSIHQLIKHRVGQERQLQQKEFLLHMEQREQEDNSQAKVDKIRREALRREMAECVTPTSAFTPSVSLSHDAKQHHHYRHAPSAFGSDIANLVDASTEILGDDREDLMDCDGLLATLSAARQQQGNALAQLKLYGYPSDMPNDDDTGSNDSSMDNEDNED